MIMSNSKAVGERSDGIPHPDEYYSESWSAEYDEFEGLSDDEIVPVTNSGNGYAGFDSRIQS